MNIQQNFPLTSTRSIGVTVRLKGTSETAMVFLYLMVIVSAACSLADEDLSLWETGGMYFSIPYKKGTMEFDYNYWNEDKLSAMSLYGGYAVSDNLTLKLEIPAAFSKPIFSGFKATGLWGRQGSSGDHTLSLDGNLEWYGGSGGSDLMLSIGGNAARRWGIFAALGRASAGVERYAEGTSVDVTPVGEAELGPFLYTGSIGMIGIPLMAEYRSREITINAAADLELYLPFSISLWIVPRYELKGGSGFSIWAGIAWMRMGG
jgi:hypothetical protein